MRLGLSHPALPVADLAAFQRVIIAAGVSVQRTAVDTQPQHTRDPSE